MENNQQQVNNMESGECNNGDEASPYSGASYTGNLNYIMLDMTSQPFLHFHDKILSDYMYVDTVNKHIAIVKGMRAKLIEELNNFYVLEKQLQDLIDHYQRFKKSSGK